MVIEKDFQNQFYTSDNIPAISILISKYIQSKLSYISVEIKEDAINKPEHFWNSYRTDSLDMKLKKPIVSTVLKEE
jgi:hypothetical protein